MFEIKVVFYDVNHIFRRFIEKNDMVMFEPLQTSIIQLQYFRQYLVYVPNTDFKLSMP